MLRTVFLQKQDNVKRWGFWQCTRSIKILYMRYPNLTFNYFYEENYFTGGWDVTGFSCPEQL